MLQELRIKNFAIIDDLTLSFSGGFLVMTGETGAGKSIIVDAMNVMLGGRSDPIFVRGGVDRAVVEGTFSISPDMQDEINSYLQKQQLEGESSDEIILTREVRASGRSQSRVNGVACTVSVYREIAEKLVDIHGQSEHLSLLKPAQHLFLLDRYAGTEAARLSFHVLVQQLTQLQQEINSLLVDEAALTQRMDMLQYQIQEIQAADPQPGEEETLNQERNQLVNAEKIAELATEAQYMLEGDLDESTGVEDLLAQLTLTLTTLAKLDPTASDQAQLAETLNAQTEELSLAIRQYREEIEYDPQRLDEIEERTEVLSRLKRKYGGTLETVLAFAEKAQSELEAITHNEERLSALQHREEQLLRQIGTRGQALSHQRQQAAQQLTQAIVTELGVLKMEGARFEVQITQDDAAQGCYVGERRLAFTRTGIDRIEFYMTANVGEPLRPIAKVASGGETARIMLALKSVLSDADEVPTLIFDEIDQGIGGRMGTVVGQKLWQLSANHQVLVVTHLAQLAGFGDHHYKVSKQIQGERTVARVEHLDDQGRVAELSEMLGAETTSVRQSAYDILMLARRVKEGRRIETV